MILELFDPAFIIPKYCLFLYCIYIFITSVILLSTVQHFEYLSQKLKKLESE